MSAQSASRPGPNVPADPGTAGLLGTFLRPRRVALVGASRNPDHLTARPLRYLREQRFSGDVVVVHPSAGNQVDGFPAVPRLEDLTGTIDVVLCLVAADDVLPVLRSAASIGARGAIIVASGFEGEAGAGRRRALEEFSVATPALRIVGPNCVGVMSPRWGTVLSFSTVLSMEPLRSGSVGLVTQSGAIGNGTLLALLRRGTGLAHWFSTGDELDVGALEVTCAMLDDDDCHAVGIFLEGMTDAEKLPLLAGRIATSRKPVVVLRAAASVAGRAAAFGHTGRVVGDTAVSTAALEQAGARIIDRIDDFSDVLTALSVLPRRGGTRAAGVGIVTVSGGVGVIAADAVARAGGLHLTELGDRDRIRIRRRAGVPVTAANPLDIPVLNDPTVFPRAIAAMAGTEGCEAVMAVVSTLAHDYDILADAAYPPEVPVLFTHLSVEEGFDRAQARRLVERGHVPLRSASGAVLALELWAGGGPDGDCDVAAEPGSGEAHETLGLVRGPIALGDGLRRWTAPAVVVETREQALSAADACGYPVVVKAEGSLLPHRTELGAVRTGLGTADAVVAAYDAVAAACAASGEQIVVQPMARPGVEMMLSVVRDPEVGVAAVCRPGGVLVELVGESTVLTAASSDWAGLLRASVTGRLVSGFRGAAPADLGALVDLARELCAAVRENPGVQGVECNPVLVHPLEGGGGATVVDVLVQRAPAPGAT